MKKQFFLFFVICCLGYSTSCFSQTNDKTFNTADDPVLTVVEKMPIFPGGDDSLMHFLSRNIVFPTAAKESGKSGTVYVSFVIEKNGSVTNVKILRGIGNGCDEEVIRVVKLMPKWEPGTQAGKKVRVQFNLPVKFAFN